MPARREIHRSRCLRGPRGDREDVRDTAPRVPIGRILRILLGAGNRRGLDVLADAGLAGRGGAAPGFVREEGLPFVAATAVGSRDVALRRVAEGDALEWVRRGARAAIAAAEGAASGGAEDR